MIDNLSTVALAASRATIYALVALSVLSLGVIVERIIWFRRRRVDARALAKSLTEKLRAGDRDGARELCERSRSIEAVVVAEALDWHDAGGAAFAQALQAGVRERRRDLQGSLVFLGTIGNNAPFVGLFGTVLGVVTAFGQLSADAIASMGNVMSGIGEALVATAIGIVVALPAVAAFNVLSKKAQRVEENIAQIGHLILAQLERDGARREEA